MATAQSLCGAYLGEKRIREGRKDDLSPTERKELERGRGKLALNICPDGTFESEITQGQLRLQGERLICTPRTFGGQTQEEMKSRAEQMGRNFSLGFLFRQFELRVHRGVLISGDDEALIFVEYRLARR